MRRFVPVLLSLATFAALAAPAQAATPPSVSTSPATGVSPVSATLNGFATPNGSATKAYFQYGLSRNYDKRTPSQAVGEGSTPVPVSAAVGGLKSNKTYHFRIVAVNRGGTKTGADMKFKTGPPTTTPVVSPSPSIFSRPLAISGQLVGSGAGGKTVTLLGRPFPYTAPFAKLGNTVLSNADGTYSFEILSPTSTFQFQIKANTNPPLVTPTATATVTSLISFKSRARVHRGRLVRFAGSVLPVQDGLLVEIQKQRKNGSFKNVAHTTLKHANGRSTYSKRLRLHRGGTFRTVVLSAGGAVSPGVSHAKSIAVTSR